jgi:hypothetical protein
MRSNAQQASDSHIGNYYPRRRLENMTIHRISKLVLLACLVTAGLASALVMAQDDADVQARIESAMSAGPLSIAQDATVLDYPIEGTEFILLREGSNDWTCFPDWAPTPANDPMCFDPVWMVWFDALNTATEPEITSPGLAYMLQGGGDASNTDPFLMEPAEGEDWMVSPPHVMILFPGELDTSVFTTDHHSGEPWIMWAGTPYEHIMMPIAEGEGEH